MPRSKECCIDLFLFIIYRPEMNGNLKERQDLVQVVLPDENIREVMVQMYFYTCFDPMLIYGLDFCNYPLGITCNC